VNPDIYRGINEGPMLLRRKLNQQGFKRIYGTADHNATRDANPGLMDGLFQHVASKTKKKGFNKAMDEGRMVPTWDDSIEWMGDRNAFNEAGRMGKAKARQWMSDNVGIRHSRDWDHAVQRAVMSAKTTYKGIKPKDFVYSRGQLPQARNPVTTVTPTKPRMGSLFDVDAPKAKFDVDIQEWARMLKDRKAAAV